MSASSLHSSIELMGHTDGVIFTPRAQFDILKRNPRRRRVETVYGSVEEDNLEPSSRRDLVSRAQDAADNDLLVKGLVARLTSFVVGEGNRLELDFGKGQKSDTLKQLGRDVKTWFNTEYSESCDGRQRMQLPECQKAAFRSWYVDGDLLVTIDPVDAKLYHFEATQIATPSGYSPKKNKIYDGVTIDGNGAPVSYWTSPDGSESPALKDCTERSREDSIHIADFFRFRQVRGVSQLVAHLGMVNDLKDYFEADLQSTKAAAKFAMYVKKLGASQAAQDAIAFAGINPNGRTSGGASAEEKIYGRMERVAGGAFEYLEPGEDIGVINPARPTQAFRDYVRAMVRIFGAGASVPLELIMLDFSESNFSSNKAAMLLAWAYIRSLQAWFNRVYNTPIARRAIQREIDRGRFRGLPDSWRYAIGWTNPGLPEIDRQKAESAKSRALSNGTTTLRDEVDTAGGEYDWIDLENQRHLERMERLEHLRDELAFARENNLVEEVARIQQEAANVIGQ